MKVLNFQPTPIFDLLLMEWFNYFKKLSVRPAFEFSRYLQENMDKKIERLPFP